MSLDNQTARLFNVILAAPLPAEQAADAGSAGLLRVLPYVVVATTDAEALTRCAMLAHFSQVRGLRVLVQTTEHNRWLAETHPAHLLCAATVGRSDTVHPIQFQQWASRATRAERCGDHTIPAQYRELSPLEVARVCADLSGAPVATAA